MSVRLVLLVVSIGLADSINPATLAPAIYLATHEQRRVAVAGFAAGAFAVNLLAGALVALGPGQLVLALVPRPAPATKHLIELFAGVVILAAGAIVAVSRERLARRRPPAVRQSGSGFALGAGIMAVELPTALPYFVAIAAIVDSDAEVPGQVVLLALFNLAFLLPVLAILGALLTSGDGAERLLQRANARLERHWPVLLAVLLVAVGLAALGLGASGLATS